MKKIEQRLQNIIVTLTAAAILICVAGHIIFTHYGIAK